MTEYEPERSTGSMRDASSSQSRTIKVAKTCPECEAVHHVTVPKDGYERWRKGEYIQHVMPELSADDRETLMTGICPPCWDRLFPADEDELDEDREVPDWFMEQIRPGDEPFEGDGHGVYL
ncbi:MULTISPECIES: hypothetical protein [Actinocorallia]|uniref:HNH endonuclease n=2 Tax=Actinocorallia TaxID=58108 RepID=A0ABN3UTZ6_9ACTN